MGAECSKIMKWTDKRLSERSKALYDEVNEWNEANVSNKGRPTSKSKAKSKAEPGPTTLENASHDPPPADNGESEHKEPDWAREGAKKLTKNELDLNSWMDEYNSKGIVATLDHIKSEQIESLWGNLMKACGKEKEKHAIRWRFQRFKQLCQTKR